MKGLRPFSHPAGGGGVTLPRAALFFCTACRKGRCPSRFPRVTGATPPPCPEFLHCVQDDIHNQVCHSESRFIGAKNLGAGWYLRRPNRLACGPLRGGREADVVIPWSGGTFLRAVFLSVIALIGIATPAVSGLAMGAWIVFLRCTEIGFCHPLAPSGRGIFECRLFFVRKGWLYYEKGLRPFSHPAGVYGGYDARHRVPSLRSG